MPLSPSVEERGTKLTPSLGSAGWLAPPRGSESRGRVRFSGQDTQAQVLKLGRELGVTAFEIGTHINGMDLDHRDLFPFYKAAEELNACLFVHPWDMDNWGGRINKYWLPWLLAMPAETAQAICSIVLGGVLETFPRLRFCFAHVRPDLCATACSEAPQTYNGKFWCDSIVHEPGALRRLLELVGADRICLGTDYPFPLGELKVGQAVELCDALNDQQKDQVLWKNAIDMFMLDENRFSP